MDSLTHIALGACMGEAFAGKTLGKKAMLWGALAQSFPDIDFVSSFWMDTSSALLSHRGFTHSFLFCSLITPVLALLAERWHRPHNIRLQHWMFFFGSVILVHIFIDAFNNYGVGWWEPFNHKRISFNAIYVADPFFSVGPAIALMALMYLGRYSQKRKKWWRMCFAVTTLYLLYCLTNKMLIDRAVTDNFCKKQISYTRYFTTPAPLQNWLWYIVAGTDSGYYVGFYSVFDKKKEMTFEYFPRNDSLLQFVGDHEEVQKLIRFSQQFYTVEKWNDTLVFNDLRFGQIVGWQNPREKFVFHYFLQHPADNKLVLQRGRFAKWDMDVLKVFIKRIAGHR